MSFITNIKVNNLIKDLKDLETIVANLQIGGAPVIAGNIDMNNHSITELNSVVFNSSDTVNINAGNLEYNNSVVVTAENIATYETADGGFVNLADDNLNMANHNIQNISSLSLSGAGVINLPYGVANQLQVTSDSILRYQSNPIVTSANFASFETANQFVPTASEDLNMDGFSIRDIGTLEPVSINFGGNVNNKLTVLNNDLKYQNNVILDSSNYTDYITSDTGFVGTATSNLDMAGYNISNVGLLDFNEGEVVLQVGQESSMRIGNSDINMTNNQSQMLSSNSNTFPSSQIDFNSGFTIALQEFSYNFTTAHNYMLAIDVTTDSGGTIPAFGSSTTVVRLLMSQFLSNNEYTGSFSFNSETVNSNIILNNLGLTPVTSANYTILVYLEMDGTSDLIDGAVIMNLLFNAPVAVPVKLSLIDDALYYNNTQLVDVNSLPSSIIGTYFKQYLFPNLSVSNTTNLTQLLTFLPNTSNFIEGTLIGSWSCLKFSVIVYSNGSGPMGIQDPSVQDLMTGITYYDDLTFVSVTGMSLNIVLQYTASPTISDLITIKLDVVSSTTT